MQAETLDRVPARDEERNVPAVVPEQRVRALDGLRGLAVLAVMAYHGSNWASGGFLGVDVFFALSGFLITSLLWREHAATGRISLRHFFVRRVLRLMPALCAMLTAYLLVAVLVDRQRIVMHLVDAASALVGAANFARAAHIPRPVYIAPCWSLSVEWHFYLLWGPLLAWLVTRVRSARRLSLLIAACALIACLARVAALLSGVPSSRLYYMLDGRADALLIGCALGVLCAAPAAGPISARMRSLLSLALTAVPPVWLLLLLTARFDDAANMLWRSTFMAVTTALVIYVVVRVPDGVASRVLGFAPLVATGRISYALYLWHYPIFLALARDLGCSLAQTFAYGGALSVVLALLSRRLVELPALRLNRRFGSRG